ncbi:tRNA pseudouridine synthase A [Thermoflexales bacterium]|nr:tRNA pseudouridine synthase A [Thermoflexales bacterium]
MRLKAVIAYDGTAYHGFQRQAPEREPSIQGTLEGALRKIGQAGGVLGAGRTDAGVHASGQVIAFDVNWRHGVADLQRALNATLPADIAVLELEQATDTFHPRYDAVSRTYRYRLSHTRVRNPLLTRYALHVPQELDVEALRRAVAHLIGTHDFAAFGQPTVGESTTRSLYRAEVNAEGSLIAIELEANGFLYRMVRRIVGTLIPIGRGERTEADFVAILQAADPHRAGPAVAPQGLCLTQVNY